MKYYKINQKKPPTINQVVQGLQKFYLQHHCSPEQAASKDFIDDLTMAYSFLISYFKIQNPDQMITDEHFNDSNTAEFRFILFLYLMKPSISKLIISVMGD
jgi:hypothetical protein